MIAIAIRLLAKA
eukprot:UN05402